MARHALGAVLTALFLPILSGMSIASAQPAEPLRLDQVVPPETFLVLTAPDVAALERGFSGTALSRIYQDEEVQMFIAPLLDTVRGEIAKLRKREGFDLVDLLSCLRGEVGLALVDMDLSGGAPYPNLVVSIDARENRAKLEKYVETFLARTATGPEPATLGTREFRGVSIRVAEVGPHRLNGAFLGTTFVFATKPATMDAVILAQTGKAGKRLADHPTYRDAMARVAGPGIPTLRVFINGASILSAFSEFLRPYGPYLDETGVSGIRAIALASHLEGSGFTDRVHIHAPGETRGLFRLVSRRPLDRKLVSIVPSDAFHFTAGTMDLGVAWDEVMRILATVQPDLFVDVSARIGQIEKALGFELKKDLLDSLGEDVVLYASPPRGGGGVIPEVVLSIGLKDVGAFETCLDKAVAFARAELGGDDIARDRMEFRGEVIHYLRLPNGIPVTPAFAFLDGRLVIGLMPQTLKGIIRSRAAETTAPSLLDRDDVREALALVPRRTVALGFTDIGSVFDLAYNTALPFLQSLDLDERDFPVDLALLPSAEAVSRHLEPAVSAATCDDAGITWIVHSPVSFLTLFGPAVASVVMVSGSSASTLPVEIEVRPDPRGRKAPRPPVREAVPVDPDADNLRAIRTAIVLYYVEHRAYPKTLEDLVTTRLLEAEQLISPGDEAPVVVGSVRSSYAYVGSDIGLLGPAQRENAVLVWSRTPIRAVLFLDSPFPRRVPEVRFQMLRDATTARIEKARSRK